MSLPVSLPTSPNSPNGTISAAQQTMLMLASTSAYRAALLARLRLPFAQCAPRFEEARPGSMAVEALVKHNTIGKARSVLEMHPGATVIASDQLAVCGEQALGKPGTQEAALRQLRLISGQRVSFYTGVTMLTDDAAHYDMVPYHVEMRYLSDAEIRTYVAQEQPLDCAGSFKSEGLGITLFARMCGEDPSALIGLPLIRLSQWLQPLRRLEGGDDD